MITLSVLFALIYAYSIYRIRKDSGSWDEFNPFETNLFVYFMFFLGTMWHLFLLIVLILYVIKHNILP